MNRHLDYIKTIYYNIRLKTSRNHRLLIYKRSSVRISRSARLIINSGNASINRSWYDGAIKFSEFIMEDNSTLIVDGNFSLYQGASIYIAPNATMHVHGDAFINTNSQVNCFNRIEIGKDTIISDNVCIADTDNHHICDGKSNETKGERIIIGDKCWICKNVTILKGVQVGGGV